MVEFTDREGLEAWLIGRERVDMVAIAARAALRVLPMVVTGLAKAKADDRKVIFLPIFRASLISRSFVGQPDREMSDASSSAASSAGSSASAAAYAASSASASAAASSASAAAAYAAAASASAIWLSVSEDATALEEGVLPGVLASRPLWAGDPPPEILDHWKTLKEHLLSADEDWDVWNQWYEDRLQGIAPNEALDRAIALMDPEKFWDAGPKVANAEIRRLIGEFAPPAVGDLPAEHKAAPRFQVADNRIAVHPDRPADDPTEDQREFHDALKGDIATLLESCSPTSNRYGDVRQAGSDFADALGADYTQTKRTRLWLAGRKLRTIARADADRRAANDPEDEPLDAGPGAALEHVVTVYNVFASLDPILKERDRAGEDRPGAVNNSTDEIKAVRDAVVADTETFAGEVGEVLDGVIEEAASPVAGIADRGDVLVQMTLENLFVSMAATVLKEEAKAPKKEPSEFGKSFQSTSGKLAATALFSAAGFGAGTFIAANKWTLITMVSKWPAGSTLTTVIQHIAKLFGN